MPQFGWISLDTDETGLFGVLQVIPVALGDLPIDGLLHPGDRIHEAIAPLLHQLDREGVLGIDGPDQQHSALLQLGHGDLLDVLIGERVILDGHSSRGLRGGELPGRVHHDHIEQALRDLQLLPDEEVEVEGGDVGADGHGLLAHVASLYWVGRGVPFSYCCSRRNCCLQCLILARTEVSSSINSPPSAGRRSTISCESKMSESSLLLSSTLYSQSSSCQCGFFFSRSRFLVQPRSSSSLCWRSDSSTLQHSKMDLRYRTRRLQVAGAEGEEGLSARLIFRQNIYARGDSKVEMDGNIGMAV